MKSGLHKKLKLSSMILLRVLLPIAAYFFLVSPHLPFIEWLHELWMELMVVTMVHMRRSDLASSNAKLPRPSWFPSSMGFELGHDRRCWIRHGDCSGIGGYCWITSFLDLVDYPYVPPTPV
jgi:hypothetical protein